MRLESLFLRKNRGLLKNAARKKKGELCSLSSSYCSWHVPRGCRGPSDPLLMPGALCLSSQGAACPALSCVPTLCSDSWSTAGPTSQGSGLPSASSTRNYRASESVIGEAGPHCSSQWPLRARSYLLNRAPAPPAGQLFIVLDSSLRILCCRAGLQLLACPASLLLPGLPLPGRNNKPIYLCSSGALSMCSPLEGRSQEDQRACTVAIGKEEDGQRSQGGTDAVWLVAVGCET